MTVTTKQQTQAELVINTKAQTAELHINGQTKLIAFVRNNKVVIKSDLFLTNNDLAQVRKEMLQFVKNETNTKTRKK